MVEVILVQLPDRRVEESLAYTALSGSSHREEPVHPPRGWDGVFCSSKNKGAQGASVG